MAASSLLLSLPLSSKTLVSTFSFGFPSRASFSSSANSFSVVSSAKPLSLSCNTRGLGEALVPRIIASSADLDVEELASEGEEENRRFAPEQKLFVGNLPFSVDSAELAELFSSAGAVEMVEVIFDKFTGRSRGFGFVTMSSIDEVDVAARMFNGYELHGRSLRVNSGPPPRRDSPPARRFENGSNYSPPARRFENGSNFSFANRIHVSNLSWDVNDYVLQTFFSQKGRVLDAKVICDRETGRSKGFGFVTFSSAKEVDQAITSLNGAELEGRSIRVTAAEARSRPRF